VSARPTGCLVLTASRACLHVNARTRPMRRAGETTTERAAQHAAHGTMCERR
jgi:hypothetical protein